MARDVHASTPTIKCVQTTRQIRLPRRIWTILKLLKRYETQNTNLPDYHLYLDELVRCLLSLRKTLSQLGVWHHTGHSLLTTTSVFIARSLHFWHPLTISTEGNTSVVKTWEYLRGLLVRQHCLPSRQIDRHWILRYDSYNHFINRLKQPKSLQHIPIPVIPAAADKQGNI